MEELPLIIEPQQLHPYLNEELTIIADLCNRNAYSKAHIPGAIHLEYKEIILARPPVMGLLPETFQLQKIALSLGLTPDKHVIAYDDEGGGKAARLIWTLESMGHKHLSLLSGGLDTWKQQQYPPQGSRSYDPLENPTYPISATDRGITSKEEILGILGNPEVVLLDTRSPEEFAGTKKFAERGGHIPGAINIDWVRIMDTNHEKRIRPESELHDMLENEGVTTDQSIIVYCHTHHRSALLYVVLKSLGYQRVKGYPGSWSEWGNCDDTPIEEGA